MAAAIALVAMIPLTPPGAAAAKSRRVERESFELAAELPKSHGYTVAITSFDHRHISLLAGKGSLLASYTVVGRANRNRLEADFGRFGRVSLRFQSKRQRAGKTPPSCHGRTPQDQLGQMRGTIRFRGTNGFIDIRTNHARAGTSHSPRQVCESHRSRGGKEGNSNGPPKPQPHPHSLSQRLLRRLGRAKPGGDEAPAVQLLVANRQTEAGRLELAAFTVPEFLGLVTVAAQERVGRVQVERGTLAIVDPAVLKVDKPSAKPRRATLKLPNPFSGRGSYLEAPGAEPSWTGSLRVHLPGEARVPLTGPEFDVNVCRATTAQQVEACVELIPEDRLRQRLPLPAFG